MHRKGPVTQNSAKASDVKPWADPDHPSYHKVKTENCLGCGYACAKSAWGAWCYTCNVKRMTRINERLEPVRRAVEKQSP